MVIADQAAEGLAAELAEFLLVDLLEQRALVPARAGECLEIAIELALRDVHHLDLQLRIRLRVEDEVVETAPGAFDLLEFRCVKHLVHLLGQLGVEPRDHLLDRVDDVALDQGLVRQRLIDQGRNRVLDLGRRAFRLGLETLLQDRREIVDLARLDCCPAGLLGLCFRCHCRLARLTACRPCPVHADRIASDRPEHQSRESRFPASRSALRGGPAPRLSSPSCLRKVRPCRACPSAPP